MSGSGLTVPVLQHKPAYRGHQGDTRGTTRPGESSDRISCSSAQSSLTSSQQFSQRLEVEWSPGDRKIVLRAGGKIILEQPATAVGQPLTDTDIMITLTFPTLKVPVFLVQKNKISMMKKYCAKIS